MVAITPRSNPAASSVPAARLRRLVTAANELELTDLAIEAQPFAERVAAAGEELAQLSAVRRLVEELLPPECEAS